MQSYLLDHNPHIKEHIDELIVLGGLLGYDIHLEHAEYLGGPGFELYIDAGGDRFLDLTFIFRDKTNEFRMCTIQSGFMGFLEYRDWKKTEAMLIEAKEKI